MNIPRSWRVWPDIRFNGSCCATSIWNLSAAAAADAAQQPAQLPDAYPEPSMFGTLPAWALWMRDVHDVSIEAFHARHAGIEARPPVIMRDVTGLNWPEMPV
jgi:hypothetical protein